MKVFYINNTQLVNKLKQRGNMLEANKLYKSKISPKSDVCVKYKITREISEPLNMLDFLILDVAYMIYKDYETYYQGKFTVRQLIHAISGGKESCSEKRIEEFTKEIEKLCNTKITIDYSEEAKSRKLGKGDYKIEDMPLLPVEKVGKKYKFYDKPPLYKYAEVNNQVIAVSENLFCCNNTVKNTYRNFLIKYALLHELEVMNYVKTSCYAHDEIMYFRKSDRKSESDKGLLTQIDWCLDEDKKDMVKYPSDIEKNLTTVVGLHTIKNITETAKKILDYYKSIGYINEYELIRRTPKGAVVGIKIIGEIKKPLSLGKS